MRFEARELKPHAEPVSAADLAVGSTYFAVQFLDDDMLIPQLEALVVFIGRDLVRGHDASLYFQDAESHRAGIRFEDVDTSNAVFYAQRETVINHIFEYERALDVLLRCSLKRKGTRGGR